MKVAFLYANRRRQWVFSGRIETPQGFDLNAKRIILGELGPFLNYDIFYDITSSNQRFFYYSTLKALNCAYSAIPSIRGILHPSITTFQNGIMVFTDVGKIQC